MPAYKYLQVSGLDEILIQFLDKNTCNNPVFSFDHMTETMEKVICHNCYYQKKM